MLRPAIGIILVLAAFIGMQVLLRVYKARCNPHPEVLRKSLHIGMGLTTLALPWLFDDAWPVFVLLAVSVVLLIALKLPNPIQKKLGGTVDGVDRSSLGDIYFPISIALIFYFSDGQPILYCVPILLLTLADAVAALIGVFYGIKKYETTGGPKSVEGSIAFFTVAFLSTHIPLLLFTEIGRMQTLLLGLTIGLLVMLIEAISGNGLDNLLIPLGSFLFLSAYMSMSANSLATLFMVTLCWVAFVFVLRKRSTLNDGALFGAALAGYLTYTIGGVIWVIPPLLLFIGYTILWPRKQQLKDHPHDPHAVAAICGPGLLWLSIARTYRMEEIFYTYVTFYAIQLAFIGIAYLREERNRVADRRDIVMCALKGWGVMIVAFCLIEGCSKTNLELAAYALVCVMISVWGLNITIPKPESYSIKRYPWLLQTLIGVMASALSLIPLYLRIIPCVH